MPGDPDRASRIAASWDESRPLREEREFRSFRGRYRGVPVGTVSAGIGGPSIAIVVDELAQLGARTIVRVGSCGAVRRGIRPGDLVISLAAARFERTSTAYAPLGYPAVSDPVVYRALVESAEESGVRFHTGITATVGTFYPEQDRAGFARPTVDAPDQVRFRDLAGLGIANVEMECAVLFTMAGVFGLRAGAVCTVYGDGPNGDPVPEEPGPAIRVANEAIRRLVRSEKSAAVRADQSSR